MNEQERYAKLTKGTGAKLRNFLNDALRDARYLPGKKELRARIEEEFGDTGLNADKLAEAYVEFARRGQDRRARWGLRGHINETVIKVVTKLEEDDRLMDVPKEEVIDAGKIAEDTHWADRIGGKLDQARAKEQAEARDLLRKAGYKP